MRRITCIVRACAGAQGAVKAGLPADAFLVCSGNKPPFNTLFSKISDVRNIKYTDLQTYIALIMHLAEHSPRCYLAIVVKCFSIMCYLTFVCIWSVYVQITTVPHCWLR